ncbi:MAG: Xaa-Pro peptidase family protein [Clostridia bacterium]|nr:Xaa-Pro peptidase family protein [Clostridia bacterium]
MENNPSIFSGRLTKFRAKLREKDIDGALITKRENYIYLSGFIGTSAFLVITQEAAVLITDFRYVEQASSQAPDYEVIKYQGSILTAINDVLKSKGVDRLGFEESYTTYDKYKEYKAKLEVRELNPLQGMAENLRIIKDEQEIGIIKTAVKIADGAFQHVLGVIRPGMTESEVAAELEYYMKKQGAKGASFETIVASGERASMPHGVASEKVIQTGDVITLDYGAIYKEYCSDMTRTIFLGKPSEDLKKIYNIVLEAQQRAEEKAVAGLKGKEIDAVARNVIAGHGYGDYFGHGLGHGVGLEIHEEPRLSMMGDLVMEDGMVVTVEPGIYVNGLGGVRIEDMVVIHGDQPMILTQSTKEMIII